ncbi:MAG: phosphoglycerate kinase [Bacilli bacterium]
MMKKTIRDFDIKNKVIIIRCDFNLPMSNGKITDDNRIIESLPTIRYAVSKKAKIILLSHLGKIKCNDDKKNGSLLVVADRLSKLLEKPVKFINDTRGTVLEENIRLLEPGEIILIENTRFEDVDGNKESGNDQQLGKYWASLGDVFINDAFGTAHRSHASNVGIASNIPSGIGFLVEKEMEALNEVLKVKMHPYVVIMGGSKVSDKIKVIDNLINKVDYLLVAGGIANTFLAAKDYDIKNSVCDISSISYCQNLLKKYPKKIVLPVDALVSSSFNNKEEAKYCLVEEVPNNSMILDIGNNTIKLFESYIKNSKLVFWNGPVGVCEFKNFERGTKELCSMLYKSKAKVIIGGGDLAGAVIKFGYKDKFFHISTGGGASLEYIEGRTLPAIAVINNK